MCDTMVVIGDMTADGVTVFGKNSDREPNEAQYLIHLPEAGHAPGSTLRCTYIEIPQVEHTYSVLLSKPFWMWGAEMGANQHGVVIGNEAVFSKVPAPNDEALLGMDLLRLGLERAATARQAVDVIIALLEQFGQGGHSGFAHPTYYHNSFLIADPEEAWILETVERRWAARQVTGVASISNCLTIGDQFDLASADLVGFARDKGWCTGPEDFDFARQYSDFTYTTFGKGRQRCRRSQTLLKGDGAGDPVSAVMATLRDHGGEDGAGFRPERGVFDFTICAHAGFGPVRSSGQTTGSMLAYLHPEHPIYFLTGTAAPCTSIFKPVWMDAGLPDLGPEPEGTFNPDTLFWRHERLHRAILLDYGHRLEGYRQERDELERCFASEALKLAGAPREERLAFSAQCFAQADQAEKEWLGRASKTQANGRLPWHYRLAWNRFNREAQFKIE